MRPGVARIVLLFFHRVVPVETVFMSLLAFAIVLHDLPSGLRKSSGIGKDPDSRVGTFSARIWNSAAVCLSGKGPLFWGRGKPDKHQGFCAAQSIPAAKPHPPANALGTTRSISTGTVCTCRGKARVRRFLGFKCSSPINHQAVRCRV